jgi:rhodanese-related sulfurtransferase
VLHSALQAQHCHLPTETTKNLHPDPCAGPAPAGIMSSKAVSGQLRLEGTIMAAHHSPRFLQLVQDAKKRIRETTVEQVKARLDRGDRLCLIDVREESEYARDHLPGAVHLGKGILERDVEQQIPDAGTEIILYCGGGFRSALAADNLQKMGYTNVLSMDGGIRGWREKGYPLVSG